jgi:hypothetical protein
MQIEYLKNWLVFACCLGLFASSLGAECMGKFEVAPTFIHIDVLEQRNTVKKINMGALRSEGNFIISKGWVLKPLVLYGKGDNGELTTASIGFGRCIPLGKRFLLTPSVGTTYTCLNTSFTFEHEIFGPLEFKESFHSVSPYIGLELNYRIKPNLRLGASVQYAWSRSKTKIKHLLTHKGNSEGPNYSALLEYDFNQKWSINVGFAYNESLSKEKDGLRGYGAKLGFVRWF